jgi:hypothetical protein
MARRSSSLGFELAQHFKHLFVVGQLVNGVDVAVAHDARLIHDKDGALGESFLTQDAIPLRDFPMRVEITEQRIGNAA